MKKELKILYVATIYDYGDKNRGYSFEHENFFKTLSQIFKNILYFDYMDKYHKYGRDTMNEMLVKIVKKEKPDFLFCVLSNEEIDKDSIKYISENTDTITFNWFCDDGWRFDGFSKYWAPCFNYISTTSAEAFKCYKEIGYDNAIMTQWACNHFYYKKLDLKKIYDVTFIGMPHGNRREWINGLISSGIDLKYWGYAWKQIPDNFFFKSFWYFPKRIKFLRKYHEQTINKIKNSTRISQDDMIKVFNQSKINLNLNFSSNKKTIEIKGRNFEIPGCGGFILTNNAPHLEEYYKIGKEIVCFKDIYDLKDKINYFLKHDSEREKIALAGYERTLREHTYEKRFNDILKFIFK
jgi:spore maturation protein CgeB